MFYPFTFLAVALTLFSAAGYLAVDLLGGRVAIGHAAAAKATG